MRLYSLLFTAFCALSLPAAALTVSPAPGAVQLFYPAGQDAPGEIPEPSTWLMFAGGAMLLLPRLYSAVRKNTSPQTE